MIKRLFFFILILCCNAAAIAQEYGVAIPVSFDPQAQEWSVLLGLQQDNQWWPFREQLQQGEKANVAAQRALNTKTNGVYNISITGVPWEKIGNTFFHLVPVEFISGSKLYNSATSKAVSDFVWIPAKHLLQKGTIKPHKVKTNTTVGESFVDAFKMLWPKKQYELSATQQAAPTTKAGTGTQTPLGATTKIMGNQGTQWGGNADSIYFYVKDAPYYEFTNFYEQDIKIDGKVWPTSEQYYQAMKFTDNNLQEKIRQFKSDAAGSGPRKAFDFAQKNKSSVRADWQQISLDTMRKAVREKFTQHKGLANLLLSTGTKTLVEAAGGNDDFYGAGADYNGKNWLGRILMEVRDELRQKKIPSPAAVAVAAHKLQTPSSVLLSQALKNLETKLIDLQDSLHGAQKKSSLTSSLEEQREVFNPFMHVTGISESSFKKLSENQKHALKKGNAFLNQQTNAVWNMGTVDIASVETLRKTKKDGKGSVFNVIEGVDTPWNHWFREYVDVTALQADPSNKDAVFQVASNFNGLEGSGAPHEGIMPYLNPNLYVQGEAAAISAMPGIIYRMYYMPHQVNGKIYQGQLQEQLNLLEQFTSGQHKIPVHDGYIGKVPDIEAFAKLSDIELKQLAGNVHIAFHQDIQVSSGLGPLKNELPTYKAIKVSNPSQRINQIFAAAMNPYQHNVNSAGFKNLAQMLLYAAYEGGLKSAYAHGKKKVFLTLIGGGVFKNDLSWITQAIEEAVKPFLTYGNMEINLIVYYSGDYKNKDLAAWNNFEAKMAALVQKSGGEYVQYKADGKHIKK
ncbi:MAG: NADAR family protein [Candidatus Babeliales bacterium]